MRSFSSRRQDLIDEPEGFALADVPGYDGAGGEYEDVTVLEVFYFGGAVGGLHVDDLRVEAGVEGVEGVALGFDEFGGKGDVVGFGGAVGSDCLDLR